MGAQEEVVDSSLEYASLLPVSGDLMPDDELDNATASTLPSLTFQAAASNQSEDSEEDEFAASLMAVAAKENVAEEPVIRRRKASAALDDMDDFEMISEEELAEVSP